MPKAAVLDEFYQQAYESPDIHQAGAGDDAGVTFSGAQRFANHVARHIGTSGANLRILDFGGGSGALGRALAEELLDRAEAIEVVVVDYGDDIARSKRSEVSIRKVRDLGGIEHGTFDVVLASAVIEHLPEPAETLEHLFLAMRTGGELYARTPYVSPLMRFFGTLGIKWDFGYPGHVHDLGQDFWEEVPRVWREKVSLHVRRSAPSLIETTLTANPIPTIGAWLFKAPWHLLGRRYRLVGGWEVVLQRGS